MPSKIEWTEQTWNPVTGCTKISEGCQNCYAEKMHKRLQAMDLQTGKNPKYRRDFNCINFHLEELYGRISGKNKLIFVNSMSDTFHENITDEQLDSLFLQIMLCPKGHTYQILTKRSERLRKYTPTCVINKYEGNIFDGYPENAWLGVTVELAKYKHRIDDLRQTNAKVKFLSCEPLLGDLGELDLTGIDWVIVGGESGHNARPMHPDWVRNIQRQCQEQGVPFFFKQWGEWCSINQLEGIQQGRLRNAREYSFDKNLTIYKVGKKKAGCLLDGKEYKEYPARATNINK